ncbi:MAG: hypothetical protein AUG48_02820 [Actinobacteria bacterium 13_1_20CM_3_68_9]|nr:MAG: hypothetical protein AUG48_02820 [Actinobacteria bacterium 13_1_20CM_3_68_9]
MSVEYGCAVTLHPAENRGYRELYLTGGQAVKRLRRLGAAFGGTPARELLDRAADSISHLLEELTPLTARHDLHGGVVAEGSGASLGTLRGAVLDRFLERNQALRLAVGDLEHLATLLGYLASVSETRGDAKLPEFSRSWERRLRRQATAVRRAAIELGGDPDSAVEPLDNSPAGRAAHAIAWTVGTVGEWADRQVARRNRQ